MTKYFASREYVLLVVSLWGACFFAQPMPTYAAQAALSIEPATAVYPIGEPFTVDVRLDTGDGPVGSADVTIAYTVGDIEYIGVDDDGSVFSTVLIDSQREPGRVDISALVSRGQEPYVGTDGLVARVTFMPLRNVATQVRIVSGSARSPMSLTASVAEVVDQLASIGSATYTLVPREIVAPQQLAASVAYASTDSTITFDPEPVDGWFGTSTVKASWKLPEGVSALRTGVSTTSNTLPTKMYVVPVSSVTLEDLEEGEQYFLLQFEQGTTWGSVISAPIRIDTSAPDALTIEPAKMRDDTDERLGFYIEAHDAFSSVSRYEVGIDGGDATPWERPQDGMYRPTGINAGEHVLTVVAYDTVGNSTSSDHLFMVDTIEAPVLTELPDRVLTGDVITVHGTTYPNSEVTVFLAFNDGEPSERTVRSDAEGSFTATLTDGARAGKYTVWFTVTDTYGAKSAPSIKRSVDVSQPFIMLFGKTAVTYLSVLVPLVALILILGLVLWLVYAYVRGYRRHVRVETNEAYAVVQEEFDALRKELVHEIGLLEKANRSRELTHEEMRIFSELSKRLEYIESHIEQEIDDIEAVNIEQVASSGVGHDTLGKYQRSIAQGESQDTVLPSRRTKKPVVQGGHTVRIERAR